MNKSVMAVLLFAAIVLAGVAVYYNVASQPSVENPTPEQLDELTETVAVRFRVLPPEETPEGQTIYVSGSVPALGSWDAAGLPLLPQADGTHIGTAELTNNIEYAFKVTRGTWSSVERGADGEELDDRTVTAAADTTVDVSVETWVDEGKSVPGRITTTGDIREHKLPPSEILGDSRSLIVYLPPNYDADTDARYPVLYMHDGQNLFNEQTSFAGIEWKLDETAQDLIGSGAIEPVMIVGIYSTDTPRNEEFTPNGTEANDPDVEAGNGDAYAEFVAHEVKPFIDGKYRTKPERASTAIAGAGRGAVISIHCAKTHAETFGMVGALSPWFWGGLPEHVEGWAGDGSAFGSTRFFVDTADLAQTLGDAGVEHTLVAASESEDDNKESAWARRAGEMLVYFFGAGE